MALLILLLIPIVILTYLAGRDVVRPPAVYTTSADILIPARDPETGALPPGVPPVLLQGQIELALSSSTTDVALQEAGLDPDVTNDVGFSARLSPTSTLMTLTVSAMKPEVAAAVMDEYADAYNNARRQSVLDFAVTQAEYNVKVIAALRRRIAAVESQLAPPFPEIVPDGAQVVPPLGASSEQILLAYERNALYNELQRHQVEYSLQVTTASIPGDYAEIIQRRSAARTTPPPPSPLVPILQILGIGLLLALGLPVLLDRLDRTITETRAAPTALRARLLGTIPFLPRRLHHGFAAPGSLWDGAFRSLAATSISTDALPKAIMVTAPTGSAHDTVAANFASALASLGVTVALIGTVPRQDWFLHGSGSDLDDAPGDGGAGHTEDELEGWDATGPTEVTPEVTEDGDEETVESHVEDEDEDEDEGEPEGTEGTEVAEVDLSGEAVTPHGGVVLNFAELLEDAQAGRLTGDIRGLLSSQLVPNLYVIPPGDGRSDLTLDGLPPLLDALSASEIDVTVIAGPALLEDPDATIMAWSTRHVLWALELGRVAARDARLASERLELAGVEPFGVAVVSRRSLRG